MNFERFEHAIDLLRRGNIDECLYGLKQIRGILPLNLGDKNRELIERFSRQYSLPRLTNSTWKHRLIAYEEFAKALREEGL